MIKYSEMHETTTQMYNNNKDESLQTNANPVQLTDATKSQGTYIYIYIYTSVLHGDPHGICVYLLAYVICMYVGFVAISATISFAGAS